jgi:hypothetical protein
MPAEQSCDVVPRLGNVGGSWGTGVLQRRSTGLNSSDFLYYVLILAPLLTHRLCYILLSMQLRLPYQPDTATPASLAVKGFNRADR